MMSTNSNLPELNPEQRQIVETIDGALLVLAPVGTGKTRVLAERAFYAVQNGVPASRILCLTFTNRAADQMRERVASYDQQVAREMTIRTFHSMCAYFLRQEAKHIGLPADFVIYDDIDSAELVAEAFGITRPDSRDAKDALGNIANCKVKADATLLFGSEDWDRIFAPMGQSRVAKAKRYQALLRERHALDFADLVFYTRLALLRYPEIRARWEQRYDFIQVDEVQDTHLSEYEIVSMLARNARSIALIGDMDQTIYTWRGSEPEEVRDRFRQEFRPKKMDLIWNYRATETLLLAADAFANSFYHRFTRIKPAPSCPAGELIRVYRAGDPWQEGTWIAEQISRQARGNPDFPYRRVAILSRTNRRATLVADALESQGIPVVTIEAFEFFRRQEIKDALAYLRVLVNPHDAYAVQRMLLRPSRGIGSATLHAIHEQGGPAGLRLVDMIKPVTLQRLDPYAALLQSYTQGDIVVFDVETTGLVVGEDEVIELAATKLHRGRPISQFHAYLRNTKPVGDSEAVHGHSDAFLRANGQPPAQVLRAFMDYIRGAHLVGHNVGFDIKMVAAQARRWDIDVTMGLWSDTWNIAERFVNAENYRLGTLAEALALNVTPTHKASDDVDTTVALLHALIPLIERNQRQRQRVVADYGKAFVSLAEQVSQWRTAMLTLRPPDLLGRILVASGLWEHYAREPQRQQNLSRLIDIFRQKDDPALHPETAIRRLLEFTALARNLDLISPDENKVLAITVHQAKGLEFDTVFIAGAVENEFPSWFSVQDGDIEEEKRLFYVAMTRAKQRLFISSYQKNEKRYKSAESRFIHSIPPALIRRQ